jgi:hypothetical protein
MNPISNLDIFNSAIESWNAGDLDGYLSMYDESVLLYGYSPEPLDKAGVVARYTALWANLSMPGRNGLCSRLTMYLRQGIGSSVSSRCPAYNPETS